VLVRELHRANEQADARSRPRKSGARQPPISPVSRSRQGPALSRLAGQEAFPAPLRHQVPGTPPQPALSLRVTPGGEHYRKVPRRVRLQSQSCHMQTWPPLPHRAGTSPPGVPRKADQKALGACNELSMACCWFPHCRRPDITDRLQPNAGHGSEPIRSIPAKAGTMILALAFRCR
jgi:hypothetical protein